MLDLLAKYKKVVDTGNITKASKELFITQSALTQSLQKLEKHYKSRLLIRSRSGVTPTKVGQIVYEYSSNTIQEEKNIQKKIDEHKNVTENHIRIGMIDNVGLVFVRNIYSQLIKQTPEINLQIEIDNSARLIKQIEKQSIDFAIITKPEKRLSRKFQQLDFANENLLLVGKRKITSRITTVKDLQKIDFISYNENSKTHKQITQAFKDKKVKVNFKIFSSSPDFILEMVKQGMGLTVLPENIVNDEIEKGTIEKVVVGIQFKRELSLINLKKNYLTKTTEEFIEKLRKAYQ